MERHTVGEDAGTPSADTTMTERRHDIDAVRVFAFTLLILYHVGMAYVADRGFHLKSVHPRSGCSGP